VVPGETLTLQVQASDFDDILGPNVARTPERTLRVVTRDELVAELQRREQEYRLDFERLVDAQEQVRSRLLTTLGQFQKNADAPTVAGELTALERRQWNIAASVNVVRQQFEQILSEMRVNRLDTAEERERLGDRIIEPLTQLSRRDLPKAADAVRQWSRETTSERASAVDPLQVALLSRMRAVLENMIQWEGYQEVISMLRDIIRLQQELHDETKKTLEDQASDVFDD
jgi:DNA-binding ferritin-like protein